MGIILILAAVIVIFTILAFLLDSKCHDGLAIISGGLAVATGMICLLLLIAVIGTAIGAPKELPALQAQAAEYQALVDSHSQDTDFDALYANIVTFNERVRENRDKSESFWLKGLYSPIWHDVPTVNITPN